MVVLVFIIPCTCSTHCVYLILGEHHLHDGIQLLNLLILRAYGLQVVLIGVLLHLLQVAHLILGVLQLLPEVVSQLP
jgi:hypothetical protein